MRDLIRAAMARDPAARGISGVLEIVLTYSGVHAVVVHRASHYLWRIGIPQIVFTGGEPLLRDDLVSLVGEAEEFVTGLVTNGTRLKRKLNPYGMPASTMCRSPSNPMIPRSTTAWWAPTISMPLRGPWRGSERLWISAWRW